MGLYRVRREDALKRLENTTRNLERVLDIMSELEPRLRSLERQAKRAIEYIRAQADLKIILREWYGYHWHHAQRELTDSREVVKAQDSRVHEAREIHVRAQAEYNTFRERLTGLRTQLNAWHRQSAELHNQREEASRGLAVLEERQRSLLSAQSSVLADQNRTSDEEQIARERLIEAEGEVTRLQIEFEEAQRQFADAQQGLQDRQVERSSVEERLTSARAEVERWSAQRSESQARLDELKSRLENLGARLESANKAIESAEENARQAEQRHLQASQSREEAEARLNEAESQLREKRGSGRAT